MKTLYYKKTLLLVSAVLFLSFFSVTSASAQIRYTETDTIDGIKVMYRWQRSNIFKKESRTILNLRLTNTNDHPVNVELSVGFYKSGILVYQSEEHKKCFKPGQSKRGGPAGLRFQSEDLTLEDIESEKFDWSFAKFEVEEVDECP